MSKQVANQGSVVRDFLRPFSITDPRCLHDGTVVSHAIHETDEPVVQYGKFLPTELFDEGRTHGLRQRVSVEVVQMATRKGHPTSDRSPSTFRRGTRERGIPYSRWSRGKGPIVSSGGRWSKPVRPNSTADFRHTPMWRKWGGKDRLTKCGWWPSWTRKHSKKRDSSRAFCENQRKTTGDLEARLPSRLCAVASENLSPKQMHCRGCAKRRFDPIGEGGCRPNSLRDKR